MKTLYRVCVRLVTLTIPVVIAACYGPPSRYSILGHVIDKTTHAPIGSVEIDCIDSKGTVETSATSLADGSFDLYYDTVCDHLQVTPLAVDGGVGYQSTTVPVSASDTTVTVQLDEVP